MQLHVVQEMLQFCATDASEFEESDEDLMVLSAETQCPDTETSAIRLQCQVAEHSVVFLLDSGSSHSFLSTRLGEHMEGKVALPRQQKVRIAGGGHLVCDQMIPQCTWTVDGNQFTTDFKLLPLQHYDGIIGMD